MTIINKIYYDPKGPWGFMPKIHQPDGNDPFHSDYPLGFRWIPRTFTSFIFIDALLLEGEPLHYVNRYTLEQSAGIVKYGIDWLPKPWSLPGTHQKTQIIFKDPISGKKMEGIYRQTTYGNGFGWRVGPRFSDDDVDGKPAFYVNAVPSKVLEWLTFGTKRVEVK